mmetsp:Transcript_43593/g.81297  ORF Transcript_43593/g.81297 Transcript_43593/m.81297 type:complete len:589 (-) Transcript_43593:25-1791(-)
MRTVQILLTLWFFLQGWAHDSQQEEPNQETEEPWATAEAVDCVVSPWHTNGPCSVSCGSGMQKLSRKITQAPHGGLPCPGLVDFIVCDMAPCHAHLPKAGESAEKMEVVVECKVGPWKAHGSCSVSCGTGVQTITREILQHPAGGLECPPLLQQVQCERDACPDTCEQEPSFESRRHGKGHGGARGGKGQRPAWGDSSSVDCRVSEWTRSGGCSRHCDGGDQLYTRAVLVQPLGRGKACPRLEKVERCNRRQCRYHEVLENLRNSLDNFSSAELLSSAEDHAEGFKTLVKTSMDLRDNAGKEWATFVDKVRTFADDYSAAIKDMSNARTRLKMLAEHVPDRLEGLVQSLRRGNSDDANSSLARLVSKLSTAQVEARKVEGVFATIKVPAANYREMALDQTEEHAQVDAHSRRLGSQGVAGFVKKEGMDYPGNDISCGEFHSLRLAAAACRDHPLCGGFTVVDNVPWCLKEISDGQAVARNDHDLYIRQDVAEIFLKQDAAENAVQTPQRAALYRDRWSAVGDVLWDVEKMLETVLHQLGHVQTQLPEIGAALTELESVLPDASAHARVNVLISEIGQGFTSVIESLMQ